LKEDQVVRIEEKPKKPKSNYAVIGIYFYDSAVFDIIKTLNPSDRGELEISDVNNRYIEKGLMTWDLLEGWWTDAGTFESLLRANQLVAQTGANKL
jgi:glucose-1-phosphate thymidylyltransferase